MKEDLNSIEQTNTIRKLLALASEMHITAQMLDKHVWNEQANNGGLYSQIDYLMLGYQDCRIAFENVKAIFENIALENKINARREN